MEVETYYTDGQLNQKSANKAIFRKLRKFLPTMCTTLVEEFSNSYNCYELIESFKAFRIS